MQFILSQRFFFDAAHYLDNTLYPKVNGRLHGHTYHAEVSVKGPKHPEHGWVIDLLYFEERIKSVRDTLDHQCLNDIKNLGQPTLENLCEFIAESLKDLQPRVYKVRVWREVTGNSCELILENHTHPT